MQQTKSEFRKSRLTIFRSDFREAQDFARYILKKRLHSVKSPTAQARLVHRAFNASLIISYMRPFHKSNEPQGYARAALKADEPGVLDDAEKALHEIVKRKRDQVFAHSDSQAREIPGWNYEGAHMKFYFYVFDPLTEQQTKSLLRMIRKWIDHIESLRERAELQSESIRSVE
jgi:hypothetical protein